MGTEPSGLKERCSHFSDRHLLTMRREQTIKRQSKVREEM